MYRVEDKYCCSNKEMFELEAKLKTIMKPDPFSKEGAYRITSLYFDDYWDTCLKECRDGVQQRKKYRIRIYNGCFDTIKLEIKNKTNNRIYKSSKSITYMQMMRLLSGKPPEEEGSMGDVATQFYIAIKSKGLSPKILIEYDRSAYIYNPGNVRITLDRNLRYSTDIENFLGKKEQSYRMIPEQGRVLEVKYDSVFPGFIARIMESGNMQQTAFSKYRLCRETKEEERNVV